MTAPVSTKEILNYIKKERSLGEDDQSIYANIVSQGYDREYIVTLLCNNPHPDNIKKVKFLNYSLIVFLVFQITLHLLLGSNAGPYVGWTIFLDIIFIFFFRRYNITAYYFFLFAAILNVSNVIVGIISSSIVGMNLGLIIIVGFIGLFPIGLSYTIINKLLPNQNGKGIFITQDGVHIFPQKI